MRRNTRLMILMLAGVLSLYVSGCQRSDRPVEAAAEATAVDDKVFSAADHDFLLNAEADHVKEQALARLAKAKTKNDDIKDYAEMLEDDHTDALKKTVDLMNKYNIAEPSNLPDIRQDATASMEKLSGAAFDQEFIRMMIPAHKAAIDTFTAAAASQNEDVRNYANDMLPTLEKHLKKAMEIQTKQ